MKRSESPAQQFEKASAHYYTVLKNAFIHDVEKASNKVYAYWYFQQVYFAPSEFIPYNTVFFQELKATFIHFFNLNEATVIEETLKHLPLIRKFSSNAFEQAMAFLSHTGSQLPQLYRELIETEDCKLEELLELERFAIASTEENTIALLAIYHATQQLMRDLPDFFPMKQLDENYKKHTHRFTRSQQVLFAYYLFELAGIDPRVNTDISTCAELFHGLTGIPYTSMKNSEMYKKFRDPLNADKKTALTDLQLVRSYFAKLNRTDVLKLIDKDIAGLQP